MCKVALDTFGANDIFAAAKMILQDKIVYLVLAAISLVLAAEDQTYSIANQVLLAIDESCHMTITDSTESTNDSRTLNSTEWSAQHAKCKDVWKIYFPLEHEIIDQLNKSDSDSLNKTLQLINGALDKRKTLTLIIVLFGCDQIEKDKLVQLCSSLEPDLRLFGLIFLEERLIIGGLLELLLRMYDDSNSTRLDTMYNKKEILEIIPTVVKMRYNGSWEMAEKTKDFFRNTESQLFCAGMQALVEEMRNYNKLASFESLNTFSSVKYINYETSLRLAGQMDRPFSWIENSHCINLKSVAPHWILEFMFGANPVCQYYKNETCTDSVVQNLDSILADFETRNLTERREIIFVDFVINSINKSSADLWQKLEPLAKRVEPFKQQMMSAMVERFLGQFTATNDGDSSLLYAYFGPSVFNAYLPHIVKKAYLKEGINKMPQYLFNFNSIPEGGIWCEGVFALYSAMQQNPRDLESTEAFLLWNHIYALIEMPTTVLVEERFRDITIEAKDKCNRVLNGLRDSSELGMYKYERLYLQNDTQSFHTLLAMHENYWFGIPWIIPRLIKRLHKENDESATFPVLYLLRNLPLDMDLCPGIRELFIQTKCRHVSNDFCMNFNKQLCNIVPRNRKRRIFRSDAYVDSMCGYVEYYYCSL